MAFLPAVADASVGLHRDSATIERLQEDLMKPAGYFTRFADRLSPRFRRWSRPLRAITITLLLLLLPIAGNPASAAPGPDAHVYLLRGVLNIFSLGLDDIAAKLQRQGINATVAKVASGAAETVPYFMVTNLSRTLGELKERNIWCIGASDDRPAS